MQNRTPSLFILLLFAPLGAGCQAVPSFKYCDQVQYTRAGNHISLKAECTAPIGTSIPGA